MNILVIGNGFDLAHGLQTTYKDFLRFTDEFVVYKTAKENGHELGWNDDEDIRFYKYFITLFNESQRNKDAQRIVNELDGLIKDNVWLEHFKKAQIENGWIDFENEISKVIQTLEDVRKIVDSALKQGTSKIELVRRQKRILKYVAVGVQGIEDVISTPKERGLRDLDRLIRCLEIYLSDYINNYSVETILPDIEQLPYLDKVLSFNYTNTYERLYNNHSFLEFDYIHGKADINKTVDTNNMVLGIDEYLKGEERNENIEFIEFKKFYQRIHKETGCLYRNWIDEIKSDKKITEMIALSDEDGKQIKETRKQVESHKLFIFGHSLDITDKDVLRDLILNDNVQTTIFYMDKKDYGRKIMNLVKIITQDELIKRTGGETKTITFKKITEIN